MIDRKEGLYKDAPPVVIKYCKIRCGQIIERTGKGEKTLYTVEFDGEREKVVGKYLPDANIGDKISTHWKFAIEPLH